MNRKLCNFLWRPAGVLAMSVLLATQAQGQVTRGGTPGGGGFGGGGFGGSSSSGRTSSSTGTSTRNYPNAGTIGDAYYSIDPETRRVVVIADPDTMKYVSDVLSNLDRPKPQVLIKVVFLEVTHQNDSDLGIEGGWSKNVGNNLSGNAANAFGMSALNSVATNTGLNMFGQPISSFAAAGPVTAPGAGLYQLMGQDFQVTLRAIAESSRAKVLSKPSILARNNQPATIFVGQQYPQIQSVRYDNFGNAINSVAYQNVGVQLQVTPFITGDGQVEMIVAPAIMAVDPTTSVQISAGVSANAINTRSANTVVVTPDRQTVIIGGLMQDAKSKTEIKIPLLGDIPLLGNLFKRQQDSVSSTELVIFLTPYIVPAATQLAALSESERQKWAPGKSFTEDELDKFLDGLPKDGKPGKGQKTQ